MASPPTYPPAAQLNVLAVRLAAKIVPRRHLPGAPQARTDDQHILAERIVETVLRLRERDRRSTGQLVGGLLPQAADAARRLQDIYARMSQEDRDWVEHIKKTEMQFLAGEIQHIETTISNLSRLFHSALGVASPFPKPPKHRRRAPDHIDRHDLHKKLGMLKPRVRDQMLRELVFGLLRAARDTGGELRFDKNSGSGTLAETLCLLRTVATSPPAWCQTRCLMPQYSG